MLMDVIKSKRGCCQNLSVWDRLMGGMWPYYGTVNWYSSGINPDQLKYAIQQMIDMYPVFSGRLKSKRGKLQVVCDKDFNGVELHTLILDSDTIRHDSLDSAIEIPTELKVPSRSLYALHRDKPLVYVILYIGKGYSGVGVLINHLIADGSTYFSFVEKLSEIYSGISVKSQSVFSYSIDGVDQFFKKTVIGHTFKESLSFYLHASIFVFRLFFRRRSLYDVLWFEISDEEQARLKSEVGSFSRNDALFEFLCVSPTEVFGFPFDLRGYGDEIGKTHAGNAMSLVSSTTNPSNSFFIQHSDIRKAIDELDNHEEALRFRGLGFRRYFVHNSWSRSQNKLPKFVNNSFRQSVFTNPKDICFQLLWSGSLVLKADNKKSLVFYSNKKYIVNDLESKLKSLGFEVMKFREN